MIRRSPLPPRTKPIARGKRPLRPVDGEFRSSVDERNKACAAAGHPLDFINLSMSRPGVEIKRCLCGEVDQSKPAKTRKRPKAKRPGPARRVSVVRDRAFLNELTMCYCEVGSLFGPGQCSRIMDPAHGPVNGFGSKGGDDGAICLCRTHHREQHAIGWPAFETKYGIGRAAIAAQHYARFKQEQS